MLFRSLMQALLEQQGGSIKPLLMQVGFDVNSLRKELTNCRKSKTQPAT